MTLIQARGRHRLGAIELLIPLTVLGATLLFPPLVFYLIPGVNFIGGTMMVSALLLGSCFVGLLRYPRQVSVANVVVVLAAFAFFVIAHFTAAMYGHATLTSKSASSLPLLLFEGTAIPVLMNALFINSRDDTLWFAGRILRYVFLASAVLGILGISPPTLSVGAKPLFPFTEPSFWGYTFAPVLIFTSVRSQAIVRITWLFIFLAATALIENWTMMICCLLAITVSLPRWAAIPAGIVGTLGLLGIDLSYYADRLNFDLSSSENQTALVYLQGWQMLGESLHNSHWWGIGFQQMGDQYTAVPATFRINALWGYDLNLQDGGFLLSKLGSEFGVFGITLCTAVIAFAVRAFLVLRAEVFRPNLTNAQLLAYSSCLGIVIEVMLRGGSYFSGTLMLYVAAVLFLVLDAKLKAPLRSQMQAWLRGRQIVGPTN